MNLGLIDRPSTLEELRCQKVPRLGSHHMEVVDLETGELVDNLAGMIWTPGSLLMQPLEEGLFTTEHFEPERDYLVLVIPCDSAKGVVLKTAKE